MHNRGKGKTFNSYPAPNPISGLADSRRALVDEFVGPRVEGVDLNLSMAAVPHIFKQWDFRHDKTHERNGKGRRTNKRLPLVHPENGSKDFQVQAQTRGARDGSD